MKKTLLGRCLLQLVAFRVGEVIVRTRVVGVDKNNGRAC